MVKDNCDKSIKIDTYLEIDYNWQKYLHKLNSENTYNASEVSKVERLFSQLSQCVQKKSADKNL